MNEKEIIAVFDFDGTITKKDTLFDFISFYKGRISLFLGLFILSPILILYKIGILQNDKAKQILFSYFFKGENIIDFNKKCELYSLRISQITKEETIKILSTHQQKNHRTFIVSASITNWIKPWANQNGIKDVLGTEIQVDSEGRITGHFASKNCYGSEKVNRLLEVVTNRSEYIIYAYGDSEGDKQLLTLSDYPTLLTK